MPAHVLFLAGGILALLTTMCRSSLEERFTLSDYILLYLIISRYISLYPLYLVISRHILLYPDRIS